jgi:predicted NUDIX family phosphoesterase
MKREMILCIEREMLDINLEVNGYSSVDSVKLQEILRPENMWFCPREIIETRPSFLQLIPYIVLTDGQNYLSYRRGKAGGEARLHSRISIGFGGHVEIADAVLENTLINVFSTLENAVEREIREEISIPEIIHKNYTGILFDDSNEVGKVHLGIVEIWRLNSGNIKSLDASHMECRWLSIEEIRSFYSELESWSQLVVDSL